MTMQGLHPTEAITRKPNAELGSHSTPREPADANRVAWNSCIPQNPQTYTHEYEINV